jgi:tRNA (guanine-N7-)-methyltransferase
MLPPAPNMPAQYQLSGGIRRLALVNVSYALGAVTMKHEDDLDTPFPGAVLPRGRWAKTGISRLPTAGPFDWPTLFHRHAPVVLDLGCGNGWSTIGLALAHLEMDFLGCDVLPLVIRHAVRRANQRGLTNVRFAVADARELLQRLTPQGSVAEIHVYHPQPYYDAAHLHRRLITPEFLALAHGALQPGGKLILQTDNPGYWRYLQSVVSLFFQFEEVTGPWSDAPAGRTRREVLSRRARFPIYRAVGVRRRDLDQQAVMVLADQAPPPVFDADRRLRHEH